MSLLANLENVAIALALGVMMLVPLLEIALRGTLQVGISNSSAWVQHLTLVVGMLGGAIAAREDRLLALSTITQFLGGKWKAAARIFGYGFAAAITGLL
ncbi:MAG: TRAP transporter small permease subunit, partial [Acidobacteria bacterium]|nr:TRAP transporter small permease subunit [Acidobacteriota bacterium]